MNAFLRLAAFLIASRKIINSIYFVVPPVGLLFMYMSPAFSGRERATRTIVTAAFIAFFMTFGPELRAYLDQELVRLAMR